MDSWKMEIDQIVLPLKIELWGQVNLSRFDRSLYTIMPGVVLSLFGA